MSGDKDELDLTFASIVDDLEIDWAADDDAPPVVELSDAELLREFQWLRVELVERRELVHPRTQHARDLHARRVACQFELRQRGVVSGASHTQMLVVTGPDAETARTTLVDWLRDEVAAYEIDETVNFAHEPGRFDDAIHRGLRHRAGALRRWLAFVDPESSGDDRTDVRTLHAEWAELLDRLWTGGSVDADHALGVGLELAGAVDLLCGEYCPDVGFYDVHASTGWPDFVWGRAEDLPAGQWLFVVRVR